MKRRIGLLDQYTGENLGDTAILDSAIAAIKHRIPDAEITLFVLYPAGASARHALPCHSVVGWSIPWYSDFSYLESTDASTKHVQVEIANRSLRSHIKRIPLLGDIAIRINSVWQSSLQPMLSTMVRWLSNMLLEFRHTVRSYRLLKDYDLLVIAGGGQLDDDFGGPWGHPYTLLKWGVLAKLTRTRYVVLSVGACSLKSPLSSRFIDRALRLAEYRSYRDKGSRDILSAFLPRTATDPIVPDLAFGYPAKKRRFPLYSGPTTLRIAVSPIVYLSKRWPHRDEEAYKRYIHELCEVVTRLIQAGAHVAIFQSDDTDTPIIGEIFDEIVPRLNATERSALTQAPVDSLEELFDIYRQSHVVVASRLHGILLAHVIETPVVAISYDRKVATHMHDIGQVDFCLDITDFSSTHVLEAIDYMAAHQPMISKGLSSHVADCRAKLSMQYDLVLPFQGSNDSQ